jgi:predicted transposase/invertase (TIGR01784 family)
LQTIPASFKKVPEIVQAFEILEQGAWTKKELNAYDRYLASMRSNRSQLDTAREEGREEGEQKRALAIAKNMLAMGIDIEKVAKATTLTLEQVKQLKTG